MNDGKGIVETLLDKIFLERSWQTGRAALDYEISKPSCE